jgi:hypothetical protein
MLSIMECNSTNCSSMVLGLEGGVAMVDKGREGWDWFATVAVVCVSVAATVWNYPGSKSLPIGKVLIPC